MLEIGDGSQITDAGLQHLWGPRRLQYLSIHTKSGITGSGFEIVSDMTDLRGVQIFSEDFTDTGMRYLGYLPQMTHVTIGHHQHGPKGVTDEGLMMLAEAPKLERITFYRTGSQVTDTGIESLKQRLPNLELIIRP